MFLALFFQKNSAMSPHHHNLARWGPFQISGAGACAEGEAERKGSRQGQVADQATTQDSAA